MYIQYLNCLLRSFVYGLQSIRLLFYSFGVVLNNGCDFLLIFRLHFLAMEVDMWYMPTLTGKVSSSFLDDDVGVTIATFCDALGGVGFIPKTFLVGADPTKIWHILSMSTSRSARLLIRHGPPPSLLKIFVVFSNLFPQPSFETKL